MANGGSIRYSVGFDVDKSGLSQLKASLQEIQKLTAQDLMKINNSSLETANKDLIKLRSSIGEIDKALDKAFNSDLGTLNVTKFNSELKKMNLNQIYSDFSKAGAAGQTAFRNTTTQILTTNMQLKKTHNLLDEMATTMSNTIKWGIASSVMNNFTGSVQKAYGYVKNLDTSLNDIRIVTEKSAEQMDKFAVKANNAAKALGQSTTDYTEASLIYYQQGLSDKEVEARTETTLKAANVTGQSGEEVSEQLTAVWNGYKVSAEEAEIYVDKLAAVAASTASNLEELSTGMSKVASAANAMGVDVDQLNAQLATIVSVTRQAPESVGTALKTIYARMSDLKMGETDENGLGLGDVSGTMKEMGIEVLDETGNLRDMGEVIEDVAAKWDTWTEAQKTAMAQVMAGKRQYNNLVALFENWDMYEEALNTSENSMGTLQKQQDIYMESTAAHLEKMRTSAEGLYDSLLDEDTVNGFADGLTVIFTRMESLVDSIGGGSGALLMLGSVATKVFSKQISQGIITTINNIKAAKDNVSQLQAEMALTDQLGNLNHLDERTKTLISMKKEFLDLGQSATQQEHDIANELIRQTNELYKQQDALKNRQTETSDVYNRMTGSNIDIPNASQSEKNIAIAQLETQKSEFEEVRKNLPELEKWVNLEKERKSISDSISKVQENIKALEENSNDENEEKIGKLKQQLQLLEEQKEKISKKSADVANPQEQIDKMKEFANEKGFFNDEQVTTLENAINKFENKTKGLKVETLEYQTQVKELAQVFSKILGVSIDEVDNAIKELGTDFPAKEKELENGVDSLKNKFNELKNSIDFRNMIQGAVNFASGLGQVLSALNTLSRLDDIWNNDNLTTGEKTLQIMQNLTMSTTMLISGLSLMSKSWGDVRALIIKAAVSMGGAQIAEAGLTAETLGLGGAFKILGVSIYEALAPYLPIIFAVSAAIAGLSAIVYALVKAQNAENEAAKQAAANLENLTKRYEELTGAVQNFKEEVSSYDEAVDALKDLETGTEEYKEKIEEANKSAKELIETYKLFGQYSVGNDGLITIDEEAFDKVQSELGNQLAQVGMNKAIAQIVSTNSEIDAKAKDLKTSIYQSQLTYNKNANNPNMENSPGYLLTSDNVKEIAEGMYNVYQENGLIEDTEAFSRVIEDILPGLGGTSALLEKYQSELLAFGESLSKAAESNDYYTREATKNAIATSQMSEKITLAASNYINEKGDIYSYQGREDAFINAIAGQITANTEDIKYDKVNSNSDLNSKYGYNIHGDEELARQYAETVLGYTKEEVAKMEYKGGWNKGGLTLDGETIVEKESNNDDMMRDALAQAEAVKTATEEIVKTSNDGILATFDIISQKTDEFANGAGVSLTNSILNSIGNGQELDISGAFATMSPWENEDLKEAVKNTSSPEELAEILGLGPEQFEAMGGMDAEAFKNSLLSQLENYDEDAFNQNEINKINQDAQSEDLDVEALNNYADTLQDTAKSSELLDDSLANNEIAAQQTAKQIMKLNRGVETLADNWEDWGDILEKSDAGSQEYSEALQGTKKALADLADTSSDYISNDFIKDHLEEIKKAASGDADAIDSLRLSLSQEVIAKIALDNELDEAQVAQLNENWNNLSSQLNDIDVGVTLSGEDSLIASLNSMILAAGMTSQQVNDLLGSMGFSATFAQEPQEVKTTIPEYTTYHTISKQSTQTMGTGENAVEVPVWEETSWTEQTGEHVATGAAASFAMTTDGSVPKIETLTRTSSGGANNYSSSNKGGKPAGGKKSGGGGKGGGGGGSKTSEPKKEDPLKEKIDRYHDVNVKLKQVEEELNDLDKVQDKLFGADLIKNLNKQLDILEKQRDVYKEKLKIAKAEQRELQNALKKEGVAFNNDGTIKNYMQILQAKQDEINRLINQYNGMSAEAQDKFKEETLDPAQKSYDEFKEKLENYDDLILDTIPEIENALDDIVDREVEINIQKLNMEVELRLDLTEAQKDWNEFKRKIIDGIKDDDIFGNAMSNTELFKKVLENGTIEAGTKNLNTTMAEIAKINAGGVSDIFGKDKAAAMENLEEQMSNLMGHLEDLADIEEEISEAYLDMIDEVGDAFDEQIESYEYVGDLINHNMNLIKLIKGDDAYAELETFYKQQEKNNLDLIKSQKATVDYYKQMMETETDPEAIEKWTELWKDSLSDLNGMVEDSVENIIDKYANTINAIFDELNDKITNGLGLDYLTQEWELKNDNADQYLDTINSTYEVQKLEKKIQDSINNTDSISAQRQLNKLMDDELKKLREKDKLTQYDIDRANAKYELKLKEIALEEAQQNKTQMRLRRDASGNYSYQFVADQDSISQAQQELDEARNSLYNMDRDEYRENQQAILDIYTEFQEKMRDSANMSAEERELIEQEYTTRINNLLEENGVIRTNLMESAFADMAALYGMDVSNFQEMSQVEQDILMGQIVPNWDSGVQAMIDKMVGEGGFGPTCEEAMINLKIATDEYDDSLKQIEETAGISFGAIEEGYDTNIQLAEELAQAQQENIDRTIEEKDAIGELKMEVDALKSSYDAVYEAAKNALEAAQKVREEEARKAAEEAAREAAKNAAANGSSGSGGSGSGSGGSSSSNGKTKLTSDIIDGVSGALYYWTPAGWGTGNTRKQRMNEKFGSGAYDQIQSYINQHVTLSGGLKKPFRYGWGDRDKYKAYYYSKFDTGGYTGDWLGDDGKAAILHKKELVLNKDDTKNILSVVNIVRGMQGIISAMNDSMISRTSAMTSSLVPNTGFEAGQSDLNQNVRIEASFPGVSSRAEIEQAFENLVNMASQHAYNTQR